MGDLALITAIGQHACAAVKNQNRCGHAVLENR
jgi:hypothetical protein